MLWRTQLTDLDSHCIVSVVRHLTELTLGIILKLGSCRAGIAIRTFCRNTIMSARGGGRGRGASDGFEFFRDRHEGGGRGARARGRGGRGRGRGRGGGNNSGGPSYADNGGGLEGPYRARGRGGRGGKRGRGGGRANDEEFGGTAYKQRRGEGNKGGSNKAPNPNQKTKLLPQYKPYKNHFQKYLDIEKEEEEAEINERLVSWPVHRLQHEGYAILGCTAKKHGKFFGKKVVRVFGPNGYMPFHKFSDGDILTLSTNFKITSLKQVDLEGVVMLKTGKYIQVRLNAILWSPCHQMLWGFVLECGADCDGRCPQAERYSRSSMAYR